MKHVIVHPGFHKTATTSIQAFFGKNRQALRAVMRYLSPSALDPVGDAARRYSQSQDPIHLLSFRSALIEVLRQPLTRNVDSLLISSEDLCGAIPDGVNVTSYATSPDLTTTLAETLLAIVPKDCSVTIHFSTREQGAWIRSIYQQAITFHRYKDSFEVFADDLGAALNPDALIEDIKRSMHSDIAFSTADLSDSAGSPFGPATPLLDLLGLPAEVASALKPVSKRNEALTPDALATLLELNRSDLSDECLKERRNAIIAAIRSDRHAQFNNDPK